MPFAYPAALWLLPAAILPIVFHLFFRLRRQVREFPSLMFFLRIDPRLSAKRKVHEWLILLLRCLFLLLLILALARPMFGISTAGEKVARLVLIDNSGSMAGPTAGSISKLTLAGRAAQRLIASSRAGDPLAVALMLPDPTASVPPGFDAPPETLSSAVGKITPSDGAAPIAQAIRAAVAALGEVKADRHELHIVTDLEQKNWSRGELGALSTTAQITVHRIDSTPPPGGSVSLEPLEVPARAIPAGRVTPVRFSLENVGPAPAHVRLDSTDDAGANTSHELDVPPGSSAPVALTFTFAQPGFHWAQVWLEGDAAPAGTRAGLGFWIIDAQKMLLAGPMGDFGAMPYAVSPGGNANLSGIEASSIPANDLVSNLAGKPIAVALTWEGWPRDEATSEALRDYVRNGGTLFLLPTPEGGVAMPPPVADWVGASSTPLVTAKEPEPMAVLHEGDPLWRDLLDADGRPKLGQLRAFQYRPIKLGDGWDMLLSSANGATLLARRTYEKGRIFASGLAFTPQWSSLPLKASFVVLMQNAVFGDIAEHIPVQSMRAGEDVRFGAAVGAVSVKSLAGSALDWHGEAREFTDLPRAGVYEISGQDQLTWAAVTGNPDEADPHYLPRGLVPLLRDVPHEVVPLTKEEDILRNGDLRNSGASLYRWLMLAALIVLVLETWLANERSSDLGRKLFASLLPSRSGAKLSGPAAPRKSAPEPARV